jgi:hypothetical protein
VRSTKTPQKYIYKKQKVHVENFSQKDRQEFRCQFFLGFFVLPRFRVFLSDGSSKALETTLRKENRVERFLQKIRPKVQNRFFLDFSLSRFWGSPFLFWRPLDSTRISPPRGVDVAAETDKPTVYTKEKTHPSALKTKHNQIQNRGKENKSNRPQKQKQSWVKTKRPTVFV